MGHIWLDQNLSDPERERFLEVRGLHAWNESSDTWALRGEQGAEIMAWALGERILHHGSRTTTRSNWHVDSNCSPARRRRHASMPATSRHPPHTRAWCTYGEPRPAASRALLGPIPYQERPATLRLLSARCPAPSARCGSRRKPLPPIAEYAFLSDRQVQALVAPSGNVEWLCLPRPDSPSVFGAMLDRSAGHFRLGPAEVTVPAGRRYVPGTLVLETTWQTRTGWLVIRDALLVGPWYDDTQRAVGYQRPPAITKPNTSCCARSAA